MNDQDIIISLCEYLQEQHAEETEPFSVNYGEVDEELELPPGSTAKYIEEAAKDTGFAIRRKGEIKVLLTLSHPNA